MISTDAALHGSYDYFEITRSLLVAIAASYAGLDLAQRTISTKGRVRLAWLTSGAAAIGVSIWAVQFKGILAFHLPWPVEYRWPQILASLLLAILTAAIALDIASRRKMGAVEALTGGAVLSGGIAGVHYIFISALKSSSVVHFSQPLVAISILLPILFSWVALLMAFAPRHDGVWPVRVRLASAAVMGIGLAAMRYTSMAATSFIPALPVSPPRPAGISELGDNGGAIAALIIIAVAIVTSSVDRQADAKVQRLNQELENRVVERTAQIMAVNAKLAESEERFRKLVEALPDAILVHGSKKILFINPACMKLLGAQRPEQLLGRDVLEILHPDHHEAVQQCIQYCLDTGIACPPKESVFLALDGSEVQIEAAAIAIPWNGSQAVEVTVRDIRERKRAEDALRQSEERFRLAAQAGKMFAYEWDAATDVIVRSREAVQILGIDEAAQVTGQQVLARVHSDDQARLRAAVARLSPEQPHLQISYRVIRPDDSIIWVERSSRAHFAEDGRLLRIVGMVIDVTERKRAEQSLQLFRMLIDQSNDAIEVVDWETLRYIDINERACIDLGYTREEFLSMSVYDIDPNVDDGMYARVHQELQQTGSAIFESIHRRKNGSTFPVEISVKEVRLDRIYMVSVARDITERKHAEHALRDAHAELARVNRFAAMGELTASIAHEINQPLAAVVTNGSASLRWLAAQSPNLEEARTAIEGTIREAKRASDVIERIRALLQKAPPMMEMLDVNAVIREVLALADSELIKGGVVVRSELAADVPAVLGDRVQLQQVFLNLIVNGIEAMRAVHDRPRELLVRSSPHRDGLLIEVQDSGEGVGPEQAEHIFDSLFTTKPQGIGVGLSLSRSIVEGHGGRLWVTAGTRHGAVFQFTLPEAG